MTLKDLVPLEIVEPDAKALTPVRFAPLYDVVSTRLFAGLGGDRMALNLNGRDDRLTRRDFMAIARTICRPKSDAEAAIAELTGAAQAVRLLAFAAEAEAAVTVRDQILAMTEARCTACKGSGLAVWLRDIVRRWPVALSRVTRGACLSCRYDLEIVQTILSQSP